MGKLEDCEIHVPNSELWKYDGCGTEESWQHSTEMEMILFGDI